MTQPVQTKDAALCVLPLARDFKRCFHSGIENRAGGVAIEMERFGHGRIGQRKLADERISVRREEGSSQIAGLIVIGGAKSNWRKMVKQAEKGIGIRR